MVVSFPAPTTHARKGSGDIGANSWFYNLSYHVIICIDLYWDHVTTCIDLYWVNYKVISFVVILSNFAIMRN